MACASARFHRWRPDTPGVPLHWVSSWAGRDHQLVQASGADLRLCGHEGRRQPQGLAAQAAGPAAGAGVGRSRPDGAGGCYEPNWLNWALRSASTRLWPRASVAVFSGGLWATISAPWRTHAWRPGRIRLRGHCATGGPIGGNGATARIVNSNPARFARKMPVPASRAAELRLARRDRCHQGPCPACPTALRADAGQTSRNAYIWNDCMLRTGSTRPGT